jgi:hypothetical protein
VWWRGSAPLGKGEAPSPHELAGHETADSLPASPFTGKEPLVKFINSVCYRGGNPKFSLYMAPSAKWPLGALPPSVSAPHSVPSLAWISPPG